MTVAVKLYLKLSELTASTCSTSSLEDLLVHSHHLSLVACLLVVLILFEC